MLFIISQKMKRSFLFFSRFKIMFLLLILTGVLLERKGCISKSMKEDVFKKVKNHDFPELLYPRFKQKQVDGIDINDKLKVKPSNGNSSENNKILQKTPNGSITIISRKK